MGRRWKTERIPARDLHTDAPIHAPFMAAWLAYMRGETNPEPVAVCAGRVNAPPLSPIQAAFVARADFHTFNELRRNREEQMALVPVLERADGSLWAYDDASLMTLYHRYAPAATVRLIVIGHDPAETTGNAA